MKHKHILFGLLALIAASCTNDEMNEVAEMKQNGIQVTADFGTDTRIDFSEEGNVTHVFWNEGDQITIYDEAQGGLDYQVASVSNGGATANFIAVDAGLQETAEGATVNAIYPALPVEDGIVKLPNTNVWNEDRLIPYATASGSISDSKLGLSFFHEFAYLKLTLNAETVANSNAQTIHAVYLTTTQDPAPLSLVNGTYDIINNSVSYQDAEGANSIHFTLNEPFTATGDAEKVIYIPILPQSAGETLTLSILHHDDYGVCDTLLTVSKQVPESGFTYGNVYTYTPKQSFTREGNTITLTEAGTLSQAITEEEKYAIKELKIIGPLNGDDIRFIREMAGVDVDGNATEGVLTNLDISEATIVEGGDYYYFNNGPVISAIFRCYTSDDIVGDYMFNSTILANVLLPYGLTSIGERAFWDCSLLVSIDIPDGVTSIGKEAFRDCSSLGNVAISSQSALTLIGNSAFSGCSSLTSINIPNGVTEIGSGAFSGCSSLRSFNIPGSVTSIGNFTFYDCSSLTSITIPDGVTSIGENAFEDCSALTSVTFGNGLTEVGNQAFRGCSSLTEVNISDLSAWCRINFGYNVANPLCQGGKLYLNGVVITEVVIPNGITKIGNYAFEDCSSLTSVVIHDGVTSIGNGAFEGCSSLEDVTISSQSALTSIGGSAFEDCSSLTFITIPDGITSIDYRTFYGCSSLEYITISSQSALTSIGESAFSGCSSLTSINIPVGVTEIGQFDTMTMRVGAFSSCSSLTKVYISDLSAWCRIKFDHSGSNPLCNGGKLYLNNVEVTELVIPDDITEIKNYAFYDCSSLASVTIPDGVTLIGEHAFSSCAYLSEVTCNATTPPSLGGYTFDNIALPATLYVPTSCSTAYSASDWAQYFTTIEEM